MGLLQGRVGGGKSFDSVVREFARMYRRAIRPEFMSTISWKERDVHWREIRSVTCTWENIWARSSTGRRSKKVAVGEVSCGRELLER